MWVNLLYGLILSVVSYLIAPKPKLQNAKAADGADIPKTNEGSEIGKIYGTVWVKEPQVVWYGDFKSEAIKSSSGGKK